MENKEDIKVDNKEGNKEGIKEKNKNSNNNLNLKEKKLITNSKPISQKEKKEIGEKIKQIQIKEEDGVNYLNDDEDDKNEIFNNPNFHKTIKELIKYYFEQKEENQDLLHKIDIFGRCFITIVNIQTLSDKKRLLFESIIFIFSTICLVMLYLYHIDCIYFNTFYTQIFVFGETESLYGGD